MTSLHFFLLLAVALVFAAAATVRSRCHGQESQQACLGDYNSLLQTSRVGLNQPGSDTDDETDGVESERTFQRANSWPTHGKTSVQKTGEKMKAKQESNTEYNPESPDQMTPEEMLAVANKPDSEGIPSTIATEPEPSFDGGGGESEGGGGDGGGGEGDGGGGEVEGNNDDSLQTIEQINAANANSGNQIDIAPNMHPSSSGSFNDGEEQAEEMEALQTGNLSGTVERCAEGFACGAAGGLAFKGMMGQMVTGMGCTMLVQHFKSTYDKSNVKALQEEQKKATPCFYKMLGAEIKACTTKLRNKMEKSALSSPAGMTSQKFMQIKNAATTFCTDKMQMPLKPFNATRSNVIYNKCGFPSLASKLSAATQVMKTEKAPEALCEMIGMMLTQHVLAKRAGTKAKNEEEEEEAKDTTEENNDPDDPVDPDLDAVPDEDDLDEYENGDGYDEDDDFPEELE